MEEEIQESSEVTPEIGGSEEEVSPVAEESGAEEAVTATEAEVA